MPVSPAQIRNAIYLSHTNRPSFSDLDAPLISSFLKSSDVLKLSSKLLRSSLRNLDTVVQKSIATSHNHRPSFIHCFDIRFPREILTAFGTFQTAIPI